MGYYDYDPILSLQRPIALTGFIGSGADGLGQAFSQRTGVPLVELDRWVEHRLGCSLSASALTGGEAPQRRAERELLPRALEEKPCPVIVLGDGTLLDKKLLALVRANTWLVYLRVPFDVAFADLQQERVPRTSLYPWLGHRPTDVKDVWPVFEPRMVGYEAAHRIIDRGDLSAIKASQILMDEAPVL